MQVFSSRLEVIDPAEYHYCMSAFPTFPRGKPITNEEARAAVETELFAMKLTKPMTPAEKDAFCEIAKSRLNYKSNSYRMPAQPVDATQVLNLSAGVSNAKVFRGR